MNQENNVPGEELDALLTKRAASLTRNPQAEVQGKANFLAEARLLKAGISGEEKRRHTGWEENIFQRSIQNMKPQYKLLTLVSIAVLAVGVFFFASQATSASAQQILDRAYAAQSAAASVQGIQHTIIEEYKNPTIQEGAGITTVTETYYDGVNGYLRAVTRDPQQRIVAIVAFDVTSNYFYMQPVDGSSMTVQRFPVGNGEGAVVQIDKDSTKEGEPGQDGQSEGSANVGISDGTSVYTYRQPNYEGDSLAVERTPRTSEVRKPSRSTDPDDSAKALFDQFRSNPRVELEATIPWPNGRQAYVLVNKNYQTSKLADGTTEKTFTGATRMTFDTQTYALLESETNLHRAGKDIVINRYRFLVDEVLPADAVVAWDLSDLEGITFVDAQPEIVDENIPTTITMDVLAGRNGVYALKTTPEGYTPEIFAASGQPKDQPFTYEIYYRGPDGKEFGIQAVGELTENFIEEAFYDGSYRTASGLVLHFSPSSTEEKTSAMLSVTDKINFLVFANLPRAEVEALVEDMAPLK